MSQQVLNRNVPNKFVVFCTMIASWVNLSFPASCICSHTHMFEDSIQDNKRFVSAKMCYKIWGANNSVRMVIKWVGHIISRSRNFDVSYHRHHSFKQVCHRALICDRSTHSVICVDSDCRNKGFLGNFNLPKHLQGIHKGVTQCGHAAISDDSMWHVAEKTVTSWRSQVGARAADPTSQYF